MPLFKKLVIMLILIRYFWGLYKYILFQYVSNFIKELVKNAELLKKFLKYFRQVQIDEWGLIFPSHTNPKQ